MGIRVNIYVRDDDLPLWERLKEYARAHRMAESQVVMAAIEEYLAEDEDD